MHPREFRFWFTVNSQGVLYNRVFPLLKFEFFLINWVICLKKFEFKIRDKIKNFGKKEGKICLRFIH